MGLNRGVSQGVLRGGYLELRLQRVSLRSILKISGLETPIQLQGNGGGAGINLKLPQS